MDQTTLKLANSTASAQLAVFGNDLADPSDFLFGFELSDLTIDCNLAGTGANATAHAVALSGRLIRIDRVRAIGFGTKDAAHPCEVFSVGRAHVKNPVPPFGCVMSECRVEGLSSSHASGALAVGFSLYGKEESNGVMARHEGSVVRDSYIDGTSSGNNFQAFAITGAAGTIVERNLARNCKYGVVVTCLASSPPISVLSSKDIVIKENVFTSVAQGFLLTATNLHQIGRVIIERNLIELDSNAIAGVQCTPNSTPSSVPDILIARWNSIRPAAGISLPAGTLGLSLDTCGQVIAEYNIVNVPNPDNAVKVRAPLQGETVSTFDAQTDEARFLQAYNPLNGKHLTEFTTEVENVLLAL